MNQIKKDSYKIWKNTIFSVEAIIDETLWDRQLIINFQKSLNKISNEIYKNSNLINTNKVNSVSVSFSGDKKITELNSLYRKTKLPTNILSFSSFIEKDKEIFLGDIILSAETIFKDFKNRKSIRIS